MAERGYGDYAIRQFLEGLGIPEGMAHESVGSLPDELGEKRRMASVMEKKKGLPREKLIRFLAGKGFPRDQIMDAIGGVGA
jgi:SOS response regulatory protein OraA/RecX